jgi:hypothetical protein
MQCGHLSLQTLALGLILFPVVQPSSLNCFPAGEDDSILSKRVPAFEVKGLCLVDALLTLGEQAQVALGIEYVTRESLEKPVSLAFRDTTVGNIVQALLGGGKGYRWRVRDGTLDISHQSVATGKGNLLDSVLPQFVSGRCSVAEASIHLYMKLSRLLYPSITGFAGDFNPGDPQHLVGPFELRNVSVRQVLNRLVNGSRKAAWVVRVQPGCLDQLPPGGSWRIIEYGNPPGRYGEELGEQIFGHPSPR